jgi:hypothetical protein
MAKTFNPNRVGGGTVSIVRAADGTYSLKETGFDQISSLNMIDLGAVATTTTAAKTETATEKTGTTTADQTKAAFLLPKQDRSDDPFTTEKMLKSATDVSKGLSEVETVSDRQKTESQLGARGTFDADTFDDAVGTRIKDPTEPVFGSSMPSKEQFERQSMLPSVETPQEKLAVTSANVQSGKVPPPGFTNPFKNMLGDKFKTEKGPETKFTKPSERAALGFPGDRSEVAQAGTIPPDAIVQGQPALGIRVPDAIRTGQPAIAPGVPDAIIQGQPSVPAKKTFIQSATTALKNVGDTASKLAMMSPTLSLIRAAGTPVNESASTTAFNKGEFNIVTSSGAMQGRIVGNDGVYDPANNLFHGMNRSSKFGNLEQAGQKRIDRINKTIAKKKAKGLDTSVLEKRANDFEGELNEYRSKKNNHNINSAKKKGIDTSKLNPNEMRNVAETGDPGGGGGRSKIVCTMMNESYGFGSFRNKIWMKFHKDLSPEYQKGYHKLFLPLVKIAKTNKIIKNILEHIAVHSTIDMRQSMRGKKHLLGRVYRKILLPICYWAGKK